MNSSIEPGSAAAARDLDNLMKTIREEVAERKHRAAATMPTEPLPVSAADSANRSWTAGELLVLPAADFARAVHFAFLGREPSPDEFVRLRDRLLVHGVGRMRILREFRRSPEARIRKPRVKGLMQQFAWDRLVWSPPAKFGRAVGRGVHNLWLLPRRVREFIGRLEVLERRSVETTAALRNVQSGQINDRRNVSRHVRQLQEVIAADSKEAGARIDDTRERIERTAHGLNLARSGLDEMQFRLTETESRLADHWRGIVDHKRTLENLAAVLQSDQVSVEPGSISSSVAREAGHLLDPLYLSFEDRYRGARADIKERQSVYLARVKEAYAAAGRAPVVDIGCGRGEWLELLAEVGIAAHGYDLNRVAVEECRTYGIDAQLVDGLDALAASTTESCSAVTAFHLIEHLPFEAVVKLLDEALRVLRPGGVLILETPNPGNLLVAAERFYLDPTHRNPVPSELIAYLLKSRGYQETEILPLHPVQSDLGEQYSDPMLQLLRQKLFGPQDYGAIGCKRA